MKFVLIQLARLAAALAALYAVLLALSLLLVSPARSAQPLDSRNAPSSLYMTEPKYVFLARDRLNTVVDKVLLLGASNVHAGFQPAQLQPLVPQLEVHNISVSGSNVTQLSQIVDLVREVQSPAAQRHNTYVLGLWYGLFVADEVRWYTPDRHGGDTDIDIERYRYGFYRRSASGPMPVLPPQQLAIGALLVHPGLVMDRLARDMTRSLRDFNANKRPTLSDEQSNAIVLSDDDKRQRLAFWRAQTGNAKTVGQASFTVLERLVDGVVAEGGRVVLVDLPIPTWHESGSLIATDYRRRIDELLPILETRPGVTVLRLQETDDEFRDEVHPKPRVSPLWAQRLAATLNGAQPIPPQPPAAILGTLR